MARGIVTSTIKAHVLEFKEKTFFKKMSKSFTTFLGTRTYVMCGEGGNFKYHKVSKRGR